MKTRTRNLKRLLSWLLCLSMMAGLLPMTALAADAPAITTEALAEATVGEEYTAALTATASAQNGELSWSATGLPNGLALSGSGETATLLGTPIEAGTFTVTVTVTETIPAAQPEEPAEGTDPNQGTEPAEPTVLTDTKTYTLTVAEAAPASEPGTEPGISLRSVTSKQELSGFNLYLQPESGGTVGSEDIITQFSTADELFMTVDSYPGNNPTKIALISGNLTVANLNETDLNDNALFLSVGEMVNGVQNGTMSVGGEKLILASFRTIDSNGGVPVATNGISTLNDGENYRFLVWDGADSENQTVYYSSNTYTYTAAKTIDMAVTRGGSPVTEFANTDTVTITATLPTAPTSIGSIFFGEQYMYLAPDSVQTNGSTVTITMEGLYTSTYGEKRDLLPPGSYKISFWDDIEKPDGSYDSIEYVSTASYTVTGEGGTPTITTATLPDATVGVNYETPLAAAPATGGTLSWALASGSSLPNGLQLDANTGTISGTPTAAGSSTFTVQVTETSTEGGDLVGTKELTLTVKEPAGPTINTTELPLAFLGESYTAELKATAGSGGTLSWSITSGNQPEWLTLDGATGALSGTVPNDAATEPVSLTFQVTETLGGNITRTATKELALTVTKRLEITNEITQFTPTRGENFSLTLTANLEDVTWSRKSGSLPSNLNLTGNTISGTVSAYEQDGEYSYTVIARSQDGQTAEQTFTFTVGSLFCFTLPDDLDSDAIDRYASLRATLDGNQVTLWSGKLTGQGQTLTVNSAYAGEQVTDVKLTTYLNRGEVVLAEKTGNTELKDSDSAELTAKPDPIITLPQFTYGGLDNYVSAWFVDSSGWRYNSGDLAASGETFTLKASTNAYQYRSDGKTDYDLNSTPTFSGTGVSGGADSGYTYSGSNGSGGAISVTYPTLQKQPVTFTLRMMSGGTTGTEVALNRASLSITQYVNGQSVRTTAQIQSNATATADLYTGMEANLALLNAPGCYLKDSKIDSLGASNKVTYYTSEHTQAALLITPKLANESDDLLAYAKNLPGSKLSPTITVGSDSWKINSVQPRSAPANPQPPESGVTITRTASRLWQMVPHTPSAGQPTRAFRRARSLVTGPKTS